MYSLAAAGCGASLRIAPVWYQAWKKSSFGRMNLIESPSGGLR